MPHPRHPLPTNGREVLPALEGLRGIAALGVLTTHVSFQTGLNSTPVLGNVLARFDLSVALFFALSGFLLWRAHAVTARDGEPAPAIGTYLLHRAARILPAYWAVVVVALLVFANSRDVSVWLSNLALTQVFVPLTLTEGLTQMWSLSVEMAFYLLLPVFALLVRLAPVRHRMAAIAVVAVLALGWAWVPVATPDGVHADTWLPGFLPWFATGMLLAELAAQTSDSRLARLLTACACSRWAVGTAVVAFLLTTTPLAGPPDLSPTGDWQFAVKIALGAVMAFGLLGPLTVGGRAGGLLASPVGLTIGRWSYGIFLWHLVALIAVFQVFGFTPFSGSFGWVFVLTIALTIPLAAVSYALIEQPTRHAVKAWNMRRSRAPQHDGERSDEAQLNPPGVSEITMR